MNISIKTIVLYLLLLIIIVLIIILSRKFIVESFQNNYKIAVCMWYDKAIEDYGNISKKINQKYCDKYGYDLIFSNKRELYDRHPAWERFILLLKTLNSNKYDYVVWIDADACFNFNSTNTIEDIINKNRKKHIIFSPDDPGWGSPICTGVLILKNTKYSRDFCKDIINSNKKECIKHYNIHSWEQACVVDFYKNNFKNIKKKCVIVPFKIIQTFPYFDKNHGNSLIIHYAGINKNDRVVELNKILKSIDN
jgi:hypothetical protein